MILCSITSTRNFLV